MINYFRKRTEKKINECFIFWNKEIFQGMTRSQIIEFKKKYRKLILEQYKLKLKQESLNKKVTRAKKSILDTEKEVKSSLNIAIKVAIGGIFVATVMATSEMSAMENITKPFIAPVVADNHIVENDTGENSVIIEENIDDNSVVEKNVMETKVVDNNITNDIATSSVVSTDEISSNVVEDNIIIFDQALEMGMEICENTQFDNIIMYKEIPVLDIMERANDPIVNMWFEMLLDTNVNNKTLEYNVSYIVPKGAISFNSREGGFFADIDTSKIEVRLDWNMQKAINDSIESGVDEVTRDLLFKNNYKEVESVMMNIHLELTKELIDSGAFLEEVKKDISNKLTEAITWNVVATLK